MTATCYNSSIPVLANRYQMGELIGAGGMAYVYRGYDLNLARHVAIKIMLPQLASSAEFVERFRSEAQSAARLNSPHIVSVYDWGVDGLQCYIVMELIDGTDLRTALRYQGAFSPIAVARMSRQVCKALDVAHRHGIVHSDIKPSNIMLTRIGDIKLTDFGIAQMGTSPLEYQHAIGTNRYMSPEQFRGERLSETSDIYSLGVTMYELCGGDLRDDSFFNRSSSQPKSDFEKRSVPLSPRFEIPIDEDLKRILSSCLQANPSLRISSAEELQIELGQYLTAHKEDNCQKSLISKTPAYWILAPLGRGEMPASYIRVDKASIIGCSAQADIIIPSPSVSCTHAKITPQGCFLFVQDLNSANGTSVNGSPIGHDRVFCLPGDVLTIGPIRLMIGCKH